ncbi:MAG: hypothetical protein ACREM8_08545 [Vulcanimicrobiaceae bacterium]
MVVALLPLLPNDPGIPYAVLPTAAQLRALDSRLAHGLRLGRIHVVRVDSSCTTDACARKAAANAGASIAVYGETTRYLAMIWATHVLAVNVTTGCQVADLQAGYKGDYEAMSAGMDELGQALVRDLNHPAHPKSCPTTPP